MSDVQGDEFRIANNRLEVRVVVLEGALSASEGACRKLKLMHSGSVARAVANAERAEKAELRVKELEKRIKRAIELNDELRISRHDESERDVRHYKHCDIAKVLRGENEWTQ